MAQSPTTTRHGAPLAQALERDVSLCELLDRVLNKGAVLTGELVISVADIELLYVGVSLLICSVETLLKTMSTAQPGGEQRDATA